MRKLQILLVIISFLQTSCKDNFDEWEDSPQRYVTFTFDSSDYFSNILSYADGSFQLGTDFELDSLYWLRTVCYCYDETGNLLDMQTTMSPQLCNPQITIHHLYKDKAYYFVFLADVVKQDSFLDFYETWCQISSKRYDNFYLQMFDKKAEPKNNILLSASFHVLPRNQIVPVTLLPITYNGFCIFTNLDYVEKLNGWIKYNESFYLKDLAKREWQTYEYQHYIVHHIDSVIIPLALTHADDEVTIRIQTTTSSGSKFIEHVLSNEGHRPFVAKFNASTLELDTCIFY